jgi:anaerobic magnesium-protoporphyrin IX monomethyl ester cyclase
MKIALINLEQDYGCLPMGLTNIAAYLQKYGGPVDIRIIDRSDPLIEIKDFKPDVIGISAVSEQYYKANELAEKMKRITNVPLILGGTHITAIPSQLLNSTFKIGVIGEGERTFLEFINMYKKEKSISDENLEKIRGLVFMDKEGKLKITGRRELIKDLDEIPFPALDLLDMKNQYLIPGPSGASLIGIRGYLMTSRGCPYNCVYCGSNTTWGVRGVRWHSAERVVSDIERWVKKYRANHFVVYDDLMIVNRGRLKKIISLLKEKNLLKKIDFELYGRANILDDEMCRLLKNLNVTSIAFGLESGSEKILKYLKKGNVKVEQGKKAVALCKKYGLKVAGLFIMGSPGETEKDLQKTLDFVKDPNLSTVQVYQATPLPGTELWARAIKDNIIEKDFYEFPNRGQVLELNDNAILTKKVSKENFIKWHKIFKDEMEKKNYVQDRLKFKIGMLRFFFSYRFYQKLWRRKKYIPRYVKQVLRIQ